MEFGAIKKQKMINRYASHIYQKLQLEKYFTKSLELFNSIQFI